MAKLDEETIEALQKAKLLTSKFADYMQIATVYRKELAKTGSRMQAYTNTADICCKSEITVQRVVKVMKSLQ